MPDCEPSGNTNRPESSLREVAGFRLLRRIGQGGMSSVFLSYDVAGGCLVAIKLLADHLTGSSEFVGRFYREARLSRLLTHPNLIRGLSAGYDPSASKHYLILEYVDGPTAHTAMNRLGRFPIGMAIQVGLDIARALAFLHTRQYVHRDVKPDNILLHPDGIAKLADLGLAKRLNDDPQLTFAHHGVGTSYYMAYEQALNANLVDGRSDIFALGATLYHLLTGEVPFPGATHEEVVRVKAHDTFRPIRELNPDVPVVVADIIAATLARDPRARVQSAAELVTALEKTGLATRIPPFPQSESEENEGKGGSVQEMATRADFKLLERSFTAPPTTPPTEAFSPPIRWWRGSFSPQAHAFHLPSSSRSIAGLIGAVVVGTISAVAIGGMLAARSTVAPHPSTPRPAVVEQEKGGSLQAGSSSLPTTVAQ